MISQITGEVQGIAENTLTVGVSGISYDVYIPTAVLKTMGQKLSKNDVITLVTYH
jgi:Holliday junction resolvasome RuvABC DNA-binding subunit